MDIGQGLGLVLLGDVIDFLALLARELQGLDG